MANVDKSIRITTVERDKERYEIAKKNISKMKLENQITLVFADALEIEISDNFDLIFIDAAKAQNIKRI